PNIWQTPISSTPDSKPGRYSGRGDVAYDKDEAGSHIREMSLLDFRVEEIIEGISIFISSKLLHVTNAGEA
ncbi:hypothetical protein VDS44_21720, partial [Xanthomonas campestris pv. campestris]|nr:hypothetical protein [Xanthomonas campestris pv. campestris]